MDTIASLGHGLAALRDRVDLLEEEQLQWRRGLTMPGVRIWDGLRLPRMQWIVLDALSQGRVCPADSLARRLDAIAPTYLARDRSVVRVHVARLRRRLRGLDPPLEILSDFDGGYLLHKTSVGLLAAREIH
jgi:hypothetical protein